VAKYFLPWQWQAAAAYSTIADQQRAKLKAMAPERAAVGNCQRGLRCQKPKIAHWQ